MTRPFLLCLVVLLAACGAPAPSPPADPETAIAEVHRVAGLPLPAEQFALPELAIFGDGTAVTRGEDRGALSTGRRRTLSATQIKALFAQADEAGLLAERDRRYSRQITDAAVLTVRLTTTDGTYRTVVEQPAPGEGGDRGSTIAFAETARSAGVDAGEYRPERVAVLATPAPDAGSDVRPWPLAVPLSAMDGTLRTPCLVVTGAPLTPLLVEVGAANPQTRWQAEDRRMTLTIRPMLPDEHTCADLRR